MSSERRAYRVLLADDDRVVRIPIRDALEDAGYRVTACEDGVQALRAAEATEFDLVLTDVRMPGLGGLELFRRLRTLQPGAVVLFMTAYADTDDAVIVIREGARDYIAKPFEMEELLLRLARVRDELEFRRHMAGEHGPPGPGERRMRGTAPATRRVLERVELAAASDFNVLITGETGTGKDLCARMIHEGSRRAGKPFVAVNCGAIPEELFEAELFGHEKGAFTGADRRRVGRFEAADGGTLLLDEVGELPLGGQVKLLRAIETSSFEPVGSSRTMKVDLRVIAATNRELGAALERGTFRKDLYYRLNVIDIETPALRDRRSDIPQLVDDCLGEIAARQGRPVPELDPAAVAALATHDYPGNVRELLHALERGVALARDGVIRLEHLPADVAGNLPPPDSSADAGVQPLGRAVDLFEKQYVRNVLLRVGGHRGKAAAALGISRKSLWQRLREP
ncbi:MAG: sigma-54-dependent Fis family transcriptional regulator [Myxococcales bacterium]|nr:sigma-54-dependent Fis family transcriptional regulator [Myxococcales bacterium]